MIEHYAPETLRLSRRLYDAIRPWLNGRDDVTLIGGWAVYELVVPGRAQQSRDIDLVMHTAEALYDFSAHLKDWGLQWRIHGRNRFNDCHFIGDDTKTPIVDVFKAERFDEHIFKGRRMMGADPIKEIPYQGWLLPVPALVQEKLETIPKRFRDAEDKRLKDFMDVHNLVFWNKTGHAPDEFTAALESADLDRLTPLYEAAIEWDASDRGGAYFDDLERLGTWLFSW